MLPFFPGERLELEKGYEPIGGCQGSFSVLSGKPGNEREVSIRAAWEAENTREPK